MTSLNLDVEPTRFLGTPVGVVYGGISDEQEISRRTGRALASALREYGHQVVEYDLPQGLDQLRQDHPVGVVLAMHGGSGEDGTLQGWLEIEGIPYTGSRVAACAIAMDKARTISLLRASNLPVASSWFASAHQLLPLLSSPQDSLLEHFASLLHIPTPISYPLVLKRNATGSSFGVTTNPTADSLLANLLPLLSDLRPEDPSDGLLVETFIEGSEYTVGFFDETCLGAIEIIPGNEFYDFAAKYESSETQYIPVQDPALLKELEILGRKAYQVVGCQGVARVDIMGTKGALKVLEINTLPGMTERSLVPKMAASLGINFPTFAHLLLCSAHLTGPVSLGGAA